MLNDQRATDPEQQTHAPPTISISPPPHLPLNHPTLPSKTSNNNPSHSWLDKIPSLSDDPSHPAQIALRTYALALSLSLGPSLVPFVVALLSPRLRGSPRTSLEAFKRVLRRELGHDGFAFAVTFSVAGGAAIRRYLWPALQQIESDKSQFEDRLPAVVSTIRDILSRFKWFLLQPTPGEQTFLSYVLSSSIGILLIQAGRQRTLGLQLTRSKATTSVMLSPSSSSINASLHPALRTGADRSTNINSCRASPTLDLTLLILVRAVDSLMQSFILKKPVPTLGQDPVDMKSSHIAVPHLVRERLERERINRENEMRQRWTSQVDALVFWACSARIMWCFFYEPQRLPHTYVKWINTLANLDGRLVDTLQHIRSGAWSYIKGSPQHSGLLQDSAKNLGLPLEWGDPTVLPAYGGAIANDVWQKLGMYGRSGVGGMPCELIHAEVGKSLGLENSCTANALLRFLKGFKQAIAIYLPVHILPVLLTRPQILIRPHRLFTTLFGAVRSATFLSSFIGLYWYAVCFTRTFGLAKLLPFVSHDLWDGPYGCIMAGCLACGGSIWLENGKRRGEMALYVLPRAVRACLPDKWVKSGNRGINVVERLVFILSFSTLLTAAIHRPDTLRGLSRWTLAFVTNGPNAGFWKRRRRDPSVPPTPSLPATPFIDNSVSQTAS